MVKRADDFLDAASFLDEPETKSADDFLGPAEDFLDAPTPTGIVGLDLARQPGRLKSYGSLLARGFGSMFAQMPKGVALATAPDSALFKNLDRIDDGRVPIMPQIYDATGMAMDDPYQAQLIEGYQNADPEERGRIRAQLIGQVDEATQSSFYQAGEKLDQVVKDFFPVTDKYAEEFLGKTAQALGSAGAFVTAGLLTRGATARVAPALTGAAGYAAPAAMGSAINRVELFQDALANEADLGTALRAAELGGVWGASEAIPIGNLFTRLDKGTGGAVKRWMVRAAIQGGEEAIQEAAVGIMNDATAVGLYDPTRGVWTMQRGEEAAIGFTTGVLLETLFTLAMPGKRGKAPGSPDGPKATVQDVKDFTLERILELEQQDELTAEEEAELGFLRENANDPGLVGNRYGVRVEPTFDEAVQEEMDALSPEDRASPIPDELIAEGRAKTDAARRGIPWADDSQFAGETDARETLDETQDETTRQEIALRDEREDAQEEAQVPGRLDEPGRDVLAATEVIAETEARGEIEAEQALELTDELADITARTARYDELAEQGEAELTAQAEAIEGVTAPESTPTAPLMDDGYDMLFDEQGRRRFPQSQEVKDFKEWHGLGQTGVSAIQASVLAGQPITIEEAKQRDQERIARNEAALAEQQQTETEESAPASTARETNEYVVSTEDLGDINVRVIRRDGAALIVTDLNQAEYKADFVAGKTDEDLLAYRFEPEGYQATRPRERPQEERDGAVTQPDAEPEIVQEPSDGAAEYRTGQLSPDDVADALSNNEDTQTSGVRDIPLDSIEMGDYPEQQRVDDLAAEIQASRRIDPIVVVDEGGYYQISEGAHRVEAFRKLGQQSIPAEVLVREDPDIEEAAETSFDDMGFDLRRLEQTRDLARGETRELLDSAILEFERGGDPRPLMQEASDASFQQVPAISEVLDEIIEQTSSTEGGGKEAVIPETERVAPPQTAPNVTEGQRQWMEELTRAGKENIIKRFPDAARYDLTDADRLSRMRWGHLTSEQQVGVARAVQFNQAERDQGRPAGPKVIVNELPVALMAELDEIRAEYSEERSGIDISPMADDAMVLAREANEFTPETTADELNALRDRAYKIRSLADKDMLNKLIQRRLGPVKTEAMDFSVKGASFDLRIHKQGNAYSVGVDYDLQGQAGGSSGGMSMWDTKIDSRETALRNALTNGVRLFEGLASGRTGEMPKAKVASANRMANKLQAELDKLPPPTTPTPAAEEALGPEPTLSDLQDFGDTEISFQVQVEETGEWATVTENAQAMWSAEQNRLAGLEALLDCIRT